MFSKLSIQLFLVDIFHDENLAHCIDSGVTGLSESGEMPAERASMSTLEA